MNIIGTVIRSIIYKIPLKLLLFLVAVFGILFACFSSAIDFVTFSYSDGEYDLKDGYFSTMTFDSYGIYCFVPQISTSSCNNGECANIYINGNNYKIGGWENMYCFLGDDIRVDSYGSWDFHYYYVYGAYEGFKQFYPDYTSLQCQTEYNLIPISSVDSAYCEENNLCSSSDCPGSDLTPGVSNIFINDIFHPGAFNIIMNIPEEIDRDYTYTNSGSNFNLDVVGYNQDEEYIQSVIDVQNYKPTSDDFTRVFSNISNFGALLIACLFVILVFYMIKKAFK